jgi:phospholipid transport system substrate-binding protein
MDNSAAGLSRKHSRGTRLVAFTLTWMVVAALGASLMSAPARASVESEAFIQSSVEQGYEILNNTTVTDEDRSAQFREFMLVLTDMRRIARFTLGPYVNRASDAEVDDFVDAFITYAVAIYEDRLTIYAGQTLTVSGSNDRAEDDSVVTAIVATPDNDADPNSLSINVAFRVREDANGEPIVIDMQVEGIWLAVNQRADFTSYLQQNNGSVPALAASLRRQAENIQNNDET